MAAGLIGCRIGNGSRPSSANTPAGAPGAAASAETPRRGGVFRAGFTGAFAGVDPHNSVYGGAGMLPLIHTYLFRKEVLRPDLGLNYDLAVGHEMLPDQVTWTFRLRPNARVAPNAAGVPERPLDSQDVLESFRRIADRANSANGYSFFSTWVSKFDAPDATTVRLVTKRPYAWVEEVLGDSLRSAILPREWLARGKDDLRKAAVGAGPFSLTSLVEGREAVVNANPNFYDSRLPYLESYRNVSFQDQVTYRTAFASGQLDAYYAQNIEEAKELERSVSHVRRLEIQTNSYNSFWMRTDVTPWKDDRVRRAVNRAIDRDQFIRLIGKEQGLPAGPVAPVFGPYALQPADLTKVQRHDVAEARQLFQAAGVNEITFAHPTSGSIPDYVTLLVQQLAEAGVRARAEAQEAGAWLTNYFTGKLTASLSLNQSYKTPDSALLWYRSGGFTGANAYDTKWSRSDIDAAIDRAAGIMDATQRADAYRETARQILAADPPFLNIFQVGGNPVVRDNVRGFDAGPGSMSTFLIRQFWMAE